MALSEIFLVSTILFDEEREADGVVSLTKAIHLSANLFHRGKNLYLNLSSHWHQILFVLTADLIANL